MPAEPKSETQRQLNRIERTLEVHSTRMDAIDQHLVKASELLEGTITQIAALSEQITRFESATDRRLESIDNRLDRIAGITEQQANIAASLAATVAALVQKAA